MAHKTMKMSGKRYPTEVKIEAVRQVTDRVHTVVLGKSRGQHRVYRLKRDEGLKAEVGYRHRKMHYRDKPEAAAPNTVARQFDPPQPNQAWVTDTTLIRTHEGWLYLTVVIDLHSRQVVGKPMQSRIRADLALKAQPMSVWRRNPGRFGTKFENSGDLVRYRGTGLLFKQLINPLIRNLRFSHCCVMPYCFPLGG